MLDLLSAAATCRRLNSLALGVPSPTPPGRDGLGGSTAVWRGAAAFGGGSTAVFGPASAKTAGNNNTTSSELPLPPQLCAGQDPDGRIGGVGGVKVGWFTG